MVTMQRIGLVAAAWRVGLAENDAIEAQMNFREIPRGLSRFDRGEGSQAAVSSAFSDTLRGATQRRLMDWRKWFMERCHKFAPKLKRAWCEVALVDQGLDVADLKLLEDAMDADLAGRGESRPLRPLGDDGIGRDGRRRGEER